MVSLSKPGIKQPFSSGAGSLSSGDRTSQALSAAVISGRPSRFAGGRRTRTALRPVACHGCPGKQCPVCLSQKRGACSVHCHSGPSWPALPATLFTQLPVSAPLSSQSGSIPLQSFAQSLATPSALVVQSSELRCPIVVGMLRKAMERRGQQPPNHSFKRTRLRRSA